MMTGDRIRIVECNGQTSDWTVLGDYTAGWREQWKLEEPDHPFDEAAWLIAFDEDTVEILLCDNNTGVYSWAKDFSDIHDIIELVTVTASDKT